MDEQEIKNIIMYISNELNQVYVCGGANIAHMDIAMQGLNQVMQKLNEPKKEEPKEEKKGKK